MKSLKTFPLAATVVTVLTVTGCQRSTPETDSPDAVTTNSTVSDLSDAAANDSEITNAIEVEYRVARGLTASDILVETDEGIVTLSGTVDNLLAFDRAKRIAEMTKGVRAVVNNIEVQPPEISNDALVSDVQAALRADPATEAWEITVDVEDGTAMLGGTVESWQEKQLVSRVVKGVEGLTDIENNVRIDPADTRAAGEIAEEVRQALQWDVRIDSGSIDVSVENGDRVVLSGAVGSAFEKSLAEAKAYVAGVDAVDIEQLQVEAWARDTMTRDSTFTNATDSEIEAAIDDALLYDPRVSSFNIAVAVDNGVATLAGTVDNLKAKRAAAQDASNTMGIWQVENNINVEPEARPADSEISQNIKASLRRDPYLEAEDVEISVSDGIVTLNGVVDSYFEKWEAGDLAALSEGVVSVINDIEVDYELLSYDTYFYDWNPILMDYDVAIVTKSDPELVEDIENQMIWSPMVEYQDVEVSANNGIVMLTGQVDSQFEKMQATEEAYEAGAKEVINNLEIPGNN
ncbi:BON domain-containing protein [Baaleninema sp.]|uniref:BON domain-containing protein n=1 Tax=Baaleninema sp. TaxID=3101197 RepID=UPI003D008FB6